MTKANFDDVYVSPDPREYYGALGSLDYEIPTHSGTLFGQLVERLKGDDSPVRVADLCCSYGVNAAVLKHDVEFSEVVDHYVDPKAQHLTRDELVARDRAWFAGRVAEPDLEVIGVDSSDPAIAYATESGLLDAGFSVNLEEAGVSGRLDDELRGVDLVSVSGGIGYIGARSIGRVLESAGRPWLAALCLRWVDFGPIVDAAAEHGMVTERLDDSTFRQRRFTGDTEQAHVIAELNSLGISAAGREADGWHHADFYLARSPAEVEAEPLGSLVVPDGAVRSPGAGSALDVTLLTASPNASRRSSWSCGA